MPNLTAPSTYGWAIGTAVALLGLWLGVRAVRSLVARNVPWWRHTAGFLLVVGPAIGLILGTAITLGGLAEGVAWSSGSTWPLRLGWSLLVFFGATTIYGLIRSFLESRTVVQALGVRVPDLLLDAGRVLLWFVMALVVVGVIWGQTSWFTGLFTASAVVTVILGLALQETLTNFIAGMAIVSERMYSIGDWVFIGEDEGEVIALSRRVTMLRTRSRDVLTISNRVVMSGKVRNESKPTAVHAEYVYVSAAYSAPPNRVRYVLEQAMREVPGVLRDPAPLYRAHRYGESRIEYQVKIYLTDIASIPDIRSAALAQIWYHFKREGVEIPYPHRVLLRGTSPARAVDGAGAIAAALRESPLFEALPEEALADLAAASRSVFFGAGERVVRQGEAGEHCYLVLEGRLSAVVSDGRSEEVVGSLAPGDLLGEMGFLTGERRTASVRAESDARLLRVGSEGLKGALERSPDLAQRLAEIVALRKEGLLAARHSLDQHARARVEANTRSLGDLIRRYFRLPGAPSGS